MNRARSPRLRASIALVLLLAVPAGAAPLMPPDVARTIGSTLSFDGFVDHAGVPFARATATDPVVRDRRPWVVSPMYTRCPHTCSAITAGLRRALDESDLASSEYRVLSFSFDPAETTAGLSTFRERLGLPARWLTLRAEDPRSLAAVLTTMDFRTMQTADGQFQHPNLVAVLTPELEIAGYAFGIKPSGAELSRLVRGAREGVSRSGRWGTLLFSFASIGFVLSAFVLAWLLVERRRRAPMQARMDEPAR